MYGMVGGLQLALLIGVHNKRLTFLTYNPTPFDWKWRSTAWALHLKFGICSGIQASARTPPPILAHPIFFNRIISGPNGHVKLTTALVTNTGRTVPDDSAALSDHAALLRPMLKTRHADIGTGSSILQQWLCCVNCMHNISI